MRNASRLPALIASLMVAAPLVAADDPPLPPSSPPAQAVPTAAAKPADPGQTKEGPAAPAPNPPTPTPPTVAALVVGPAGTTLDPVGAKADAEARLKAFEGVADKDLSPAKRDLREALTKRLQWVDEWKRATDSRGRYERPNPTPEAEAADRKADLERAKALLDAATKAPDSLLPEPFRVAPAAVDEARLAELRERIEAAKSSQTDRQAELDRLRAEPAARSATLTAFRTARDKQHGLLAGLPAALAERRAALAAAVDEDARSAARERLINVRWEEAVQKERLASIEANIALETKRAGNVEVALKAQEIHLTLAKQSVTALTGRYRAFAERQKTDLHRAAAKEESRAASTDDPLEKYKARRNAELLVLQAQILEDNKALSASQSISLEEQTALATKAEADFAEIKECVKDNRSGGLVSLRLNNHFKKISSERAMILRTAMAQSAAANTFYENALTEAELAYLNHDRDDRDERDAFVESLPPERRAAAALAIDAIDARQKALLSDRKKVLDKLLARAEATHQQVAGRLRTLDEQYAFVRTNIFWVRDSEPIGASTFSLARRDARRVFASTLRLLAEPFDPGAWKPVSAEFTLMAFAALILPPVIWRARKALRASAA